MSAETIAHAGTGLPRWLSVERAAQILDYASASALRRQLERRAVRAADGGIVADFDGVRARKLGRLWKILLGPEWMSGAERVEFRRGARKGRKGTP